MDNTRYSPNLLLQFLLTTLLLALLNSGACSNTPPPDTAPEVYFGAVPISGPAPLTVRFINTTEYKGETPLSVAWNFGDGGASLDPEPTHIYTMPGDYAVTLTVESSGGTGTLTRPAYINVRDEGLGEGEGEGMVEGEGQAEGEGSLEGEGVAEGVAEGIAEGEGQSEGQSEGVVEGQTEGLAEGVMEGALEGEGLTEGMAEGMQEGVEEGVEEGAIEGVEEGSIEGLVEGALEGEGAAEGEGAVEGQIEGTLEGEVIEGEGEVVEPAPGELRVFLDADFVWIPAGEFVMGTDLSAEALEDIYGDRAFYFRSEQPAHVVRISKGFWMGRFEVTQSFWMRYREENPSLGIGATHPVERVSWDEAQAFVTYLSTLGPGRFRLPTEAEWEYACRADSTTEFSFGDDPALLEDYGWYFDNTFFTTKPVGQLLPNPWGLYDIHGNVFEWCSDWYGQTYYSVSPGVDPQGPESGEYKVRRGGSYSRTDAFCRSTFRLWNAPDGQLEFIGLRLVREAD